MEKQINYKLTIDWKPGSFHHHTVRKSISQTLWKKIRQQVLNEKGKICSICGYTPNSEDEIKNLHIHEIEDYTENKIELICTLKDLELICLNCHSFHHWGRTISVLKKVQIEELIDHFMKVNQCSKEEFMEYYRKVREIKSNQFLEDCIQSKKHIDRINKKVKYKINCELPFKDEVIAQLRKKDLYTEN